MCIIIDILIVWRTWLGLKKRIEKLKVVGKRECRQQTLAYLRGKSPPGIMTELSKKFWKNVEISSHANGIAGCHIWESRLTAKESRKSEVKYASWSAQDWTRQRSDTIFIHSWKWACTVYIIEYTTVDTLLCATDISGYNRLHEVFSLELSVELSIIYN